VVAAEEEKGSEREGGALRKNALSRKAHLTHRTCRAPAACAGGRDNCLLVPRVARRRYAAFGA